MKNISYFIQQFLAKPTKAEARAYLGIGGGGDVDVTEDDLDFSDVTTANSDTSKHGLLPKLSGNPTDVLAGDGSWTPSVGGGDVTGPAGAVADNLVSFNGATGKLIKDSGIVPARVPTQAENDALVGTNGAPSGANPYVTDSDPRNTDDRDPNPHALSHQNGGGDEINVAGLSGQLADPQTPDLHASTHSNLGSDPVDVTDLAGYPGGGTTFLRDDGTFAAAGGAGTVTSVALTMPTGVFDVAGSPVTGSGTLAVTFDNQSANQVFAGPTSGGAATPAFRALVAADLPAVAQPWDVIITKSADQTVTNNATPQADSELFTALATNAFYLIELFLLYSGNDTTGDYQASFAYPAVTNNLNMGYCNNFAAANAAVINARAGGATQWPSTAEPLGAVAGDLIRTSFFTLFLKTEGNSGNLQYQFANNAAGIGRTSTTRAGSTLRVKRLL